MNGVVPAGLLTRYVFAADHSFERSVKRRYTPTAFSTNPRTVIPAETNDLSVIRRLTMDKLIVVLSRTASRRRRTPVGLRASPRYRTFGERRTRSVEADLQFRQFSRRAVTVSQTMTD